jgi:hypothetical protein
MGPTHDLYLHLVTDDSTWMIGDVGRSDESTRRLYIRYFPAHPSRGAE